MVMDPHTTAELCISSPNGASVIAAEICDH